MDALTLCALISSKICHDLISPIGAMANGVEVLADEDDEEMREHAMALLEASSESASAKLQFARLAFGASGSRGLDIETDEGRNACALVYGKAKQQVAWNIENQHAHKDVVKILLNLVYIAVDCIPRGGVVEVSLAREGDERSLSVVAAGDRAKINEEIVNALTDKTEISELDARSIQPFLTNITAKSLNASIQIDLGDDTVSFQSTVRL